VTDKRKPVYNVSEILNTQFSEMSTLLDLLTSLIEYRGLDGVEHVKRIRLYAEVLLNCIYKEKKDKYNFSKSDIKMYSMVAALHDIGKIFVPDSVLFKKSKLNKEDREIIKLHSLKGAEIITQLKGIFDDEFIKACYDTCKYHHERWDGSGYPDKLSGEQIPFIARVVAIVDVYDALTSVRLHKPQLPHKTAVEMITNGECGMFDPDILDCFKMVKNKFNKISLETNGLHSL